MVKAYFSSADEILINVDTQFLKLSSNAPPNHPCHSGIFHCKPSTGWGSPSERPPPDIVTLNPSPSNPAAAQPRDVFSIFMPQLEARCQVFIPFFPGIDTSETKCDMSPRFLFKTSPSLLLLPPLSSAISPPKKCCWTPPNRGKTLNLLLIQSMFLDQYIHATISLLKCCGSKQSEALPIFWCWNMITSCYKEQMSVLRVLTRSELSVTLKSPQHSYMHHALKIPVETFL